MEAAGALAVVRALLEETAPTASVRFTEMDITSVRDDAAFRGQMIERGMHQANEVRRLLDQQVT